MEQLKTITFSMDKFLFQCYQTEQALKAKKHRFYFDSSDKDEHFSKSLARNIQFYKSNYLEIDESSISSDSVFDHIDFIVKLVNSVRCLLQENYHIDLPEYPEADEPLPEIWKEIVRVFDSTLTGAYPFIMAFLQWSYKKQSGKSMAGADSIKTRRLPSESIMSSRNKDRFNTSSSVSKSDRFGSREDRPSRGNREVRTSFENRDSFRPTSHQRTDRSNERDSSYFSKAQRESQAVSEVRKQINLMKEDHNLDLIRLSPVNSYLRRVQHHLVMDNGFFSYSEGEGKDRALIISRQNKKGSSITEG